MDRRLKILLLGGSLAALAGCLADDNPTSMIILGVNEPDPGEAAEGDPFDCTWADTETELYSGSVDVLVAEYANPLGRGISYWMHLRILNNLQMDDPGRGYITVQGFEVDLAYPYEPEYGDYDPAIDDLVRREGSYFLPAGFTMAQGAEETVGFVTVLPFQLLLQIAQRLGAESLGHFVIIASIRATGDRAGIHVESNTLEFPIYLCKGCMTYGVVGPALACAAPVDFVLYAGDPCSGLPINAPVTCCWATVQDATTGETDTVLQCPHLQLFAEEEAGG